MEKEELIKKEINRLKKIFKDISKDRKDSIVSLIDKAAFMSITLQELQNTMNKDGVICEYQNGANQWGTKKSPEVEVYNTMIKNYSTIIKQLTDLLPKDIPKIEDDGFDDFVVNRDD